MYKNLIFLRKKLKLARSLFERTLNVNHLLIAGNLYGSKRNKRKKRKKAGMRCCSRSRILTGNHGSLQTRSRKKKLAERSTKHGDLGHTNETRAN